MQNSIILHNISSEELFQKMRELISEELSIRLKPDPPQLNITKKEAAIKLRISQPTLMRMAKDDSINIHAYRVGKKVLFRADEIEQALKEIHTLKYKRG